jgi:DNA repair photolyase
MAERKNIIEIEAKHALGKSGMAELNYAFNPYLGCFHGCRYCYAIDMSPKDAAGSWGNVVYARTNIIEILEREARIYRRGIVGISTITDPYQSIEMKYRIVNRAIDILCRNGFYVTLQTKSPLVLKDIKLLEKYKKRLDVGITVTTMERKISRILEPYAPDPGKRLNALKTLSKTGINTWVYLGPIVKGLNDGIDGIEHIIEFCSENGIRIIYDSFQDFKGTIPYMKGTGYMKSDKEWWEEINSAIVHSCNIHGVSCTLERDEWRYEAKNKYGTLF